MIGTPGSYFEKEEKFLRECVRKQFSNANEEWLFIIASSSRYVCIPLKTILKDNAKDDTNWQKTLLEFC